jgi:hypothetical protein
MPVTLFKLLRVTGLANLLFRLQPEDWPKAVDYKFWFRQNWENWLKNSFAGKSRAHAVVAHALTCQGCFSLHVSVLVSLSYCYYNGARQMLTGYGGLLDWELTILLPAVAPVVAVKILTQIRYTDAQYQMINNAIKAEQKRAVAAMLGKENPENTKTP